MRRETNSASFRFKFFFFCFSLSSFWFHISPHLRPPSSPPKGASADIPSPSMDTHTRALPVRELNFHTQNNGKCEDIPTRHCMGCLVTSSLVPRHSAAILFTDIWKILTVLAELLFRPRPLFWRRLCLGLQLLATLFRGNPRLLALQVVLERNLYIGLIHFPLPHTKMIYILSSHAK